MIVLPLALLLQSTPAATPTPMATPAPASCTAIAAPPAGLEAWSKPMDLSGVAGVMVGAATRVPLAPADTIKFAVTPDRAPAAGTFGQSLEFKIDSAGTYRIALSAGAWIDVVAAGKSLKSFAHMEGPACSGIRKIVDFDLTPGTYTLQLSGAKMAGMRVLIVPK